MKTLKFIIAVELIGFLTFMGCVPYVAVNHAKRYSEVLKDIDERDYYLRVYSGSSLTYARVGVRSILRAKLYTNKYKLLTLNYAKKHDKKSAVQFLKEMNRVVLMQLYFYAKTWRRAIHRKIYSYDVSFNTAFIAVFREFRRKGTLSEMKKIQALLKAKLSKFDFKKSPNLFHAYAALAENIERAKNIRGSYRSFSLRINNTYLTTKRHLTIAELQK